MHLGNTSLESIPVRIRGITVKRPNDHISVVVRSDTAQPCLKVEQSSVEKDSALQEYQVTSLSP